MRVLLVSRPPANALDPALVRALDEALAKAEADPSCRAVVLAGERGVFSRGLDEGAVPDDPSAPRRAFESALNVLIARLYGLAKPVAAAITGDALGVGLVLALACDLRVAAEGTYELGLPEAAAGRAFPEGPLIVARQELDPQTARRLAFTSRRFRPRDRLAQGFVDRVTEPDLLLERTVAQVRELAAAQPAFGEVKRQLRAPGLAELDRILPRGAPSRARGPGGG